MVCWHVTDGVVVYVIGLVVCQWWYYGLCYWSVAMRLTVLQFVSLVCWCVGVPLVVGKYLLLFHISQAVKCVAKVASYFVFWTDTVALQRFLVCMQVKNQEA